VSLASRSARNTLERNAALHSPLFQRTSSVDGSSMENTLEISRFASEEGLLAVVCKIGAVCPSRGSSRVTD